MKQGLWLHWMKIVSGVLFSCVLLMATPAQAADFGSVDEVTQLLTEEADKLYAAYDPQNGVQTGNAYSRLYFDVFEASGMELDIGLLDQNLVVKIESDFGDLIGLAMKGEPKVKLQMPLASLKQNLATAEKLYENRSFTWTSQFLQSFVILLREGVEALLVITALVMYLKRSGNADRVPSIWLGAVLAVVASVLLAWGMMKLISVSGAYRENFEGGVMIFAALMMLYVSGWLYQKRNMDWKQSLFSQSEQALGTGGVLAMAGVSFLAVFREGVETIFFYQALLADAANAYEPVLAGIAAALLSLLVVYWVMKNLSYRFPMKGFFVFTAVFLLFMSFSFIGKGIMELQMGGVLDKTLLPVDYSLSWIGLNANLETLIAQLLLLMTVLVFFVMSRRKAVSV
ncbi:FTR1 family protein [Thiomicrorhabdus sp.]|uniref:FTR1 family iron permease n=1 Tax=Thiomicrorhabdus sp. TaxID=2039724 RepID=UPI0029C82443|nr:FTR1 family protein [Thiomicrorhabdus sp.]